MALQFKIILTSDLVDVLSETGDLLLLTSRFNKERTKVIQGINHSQETIKAIFKEEFDFNQFLSSIKTYSHIQILEEIKKAEWLNDEELI